MKRTPEKRRYTEEYVDTLGKKLLEWMENPSNFYLGNFAVENKMSRPRLQELACQNKEFEKVFEVAKQMQENRIVMLAMAKKIDTAMAIFALKNVAGWRDKTETEIGGLSVVININASKSEPEQVRDNSSGFVHGYRAQVSANN